jgi:hypothetical protein
MSIFVSLMAIFVMRFNLRQSMEPTVQARQLMELTVQARQPSFKLVSPELSAEIINLVGAADPCACPLLLCFDITAPQRAHRVSGRLYG